MEWTVLGSGSAQQTARRGPAGHLLRAAGRELAFDFGDGTLQRLAKAGSDGAALESVLLTHLHPDHHGGLHALLFKKKHPGLAPNADLTVYGPEGTRAFYDRLLPCFGTWLQPDGYRLRFVDLEEGPLALGDLTVRWASTLHTPGSLAFRVEDPAGTSVTYSGDTGWSDELIEFARGTDLLVLECSFPDGAKCMGHLTPTEAGRLAREAGARRLVLTHLYPACDEADVLTPAREAFGGEVAVAEDGMTFRV